MFLYSVSLPVLGFSLSMCSIGASSIIFVILHLKYFRFLSQVELRLLCS